MMEKVFWQREEEECRTTGEGEGKCVQGGRVWNGVVKSKLVKICLSPKSYVCVITTNLLATTFAHTSFNLLQLTSLNLITMVKAPAAQRQIGTRASNKATHPGDAVKSRTRRSTAEVQKERAAKADAKAAREEAKQQSIRRTAEFERDDIDNEALGDATPRPPFTPKPWPPPHNRNINKAPINESSDVEMTDDFDRGLFVPPASEHSATADDSTVESDVPTPRPAKKKKTAAGKGKKAEELEVEIIDSGPEPVKVPKPKRQKPRVRDAIDVAMKTIEENKKGAGNKYAAMLKSLSNQQGQDKSSRQPAQPRPQAPAVGVERKLERQNAIADINLLFDQEITVVEPDQVAKRSKQNQDVQNGDPVAKRSVLSHPHVPITNIRSINPLLLDTQRQVSQKEAV